MNCGEDSPEFSGQKVEFSRAAQQHPILLKGPRPVSRNRSGDPKCSEEEKKVMVIQWYHIKFFRSFPQDSQSYSIATREVGYINFSYNAHFHSRL